MLNKRRSEIEIINQILKLSSNGAKKTEILYQGNLSYLQLQSYLPYLIEKNIIEEHMINNNGNSCKLYKTTNKGLNLLEDINKVILNLK